MKKILDLTVKENRKLNEDNFLLVLHSPELPEIRAGQFVNVKIEDSPSTFLRRPISVHDVNANNVLLSYVNVKIAELDGRKQELLARIAELTVEAISPEQVSQISGYLDTWENVSFDDKRRVVDLMITTIAATSDSLNITWKI